MDLKFEFSFSCKPSDSFRCRSLIGQYDLNNEEYIQKFSGNYKLPKKWNVGLIVGGSGTGKTSIVKKCFGEQEQKKWNNKAIIDNFDKNLELDEITYCLGSVGFNSIPYWLKPYEVLSNGEKQRVTIARLMAENKFSVFDEFSSLVDRDVAKSMSNSVQKAFRKLDKQIILLSCHKDIEAWLNPDWIYDTDLKQFFFAHDLRERSLSLTFKEPDQKNGSFIKSFII